MVDLASGTGPSLEPIPQMTPDLRGFASPRGMPHSAAT